MGEVNFLSDVIEVTVVQGETRRTIVLREGENLQKALSREGFYLSAVCGGAHSCGKCRVKVAAGELGISSGDALFLTDAELASGWRMACSAYPKGDVAIDIPPHREQKFQAVSDYGLDTNRLDTAMLPGTAMEVLHIEKDKRSMTGKLCSRDDGPLSLEILLGCSELIESEAKDAHIARSGGKIVYIGPASRDLYAVAIDIGTTTLCFALVNISRGEVVGHVSEVNRQRDFGADVISRIQRAMGGDLPALSDIVRRQIMRGVFDLCEKYGVEKNRVLKIAIAGNTAMLHLLLGLSCKTLGVYPFTPVTLDLLKLRYGDLFEGKLCCGVDVLPGIATYIGADIASGMSFVDLHKSAEPAILLDIGTNGEMAVSREGRLYCTSTAAGPAFEGGNILWGTGSVPGAISSVRYDGKGFETNTIGDEAPSGICGSGVIDTAARLLENGFIDRGGRFKREYKEGVALAVTVSGEEIRFTQKDVREVQLGKSAIRCGIDILLRKAGLEYGDIGVFYLAGGFGSRISFTSGFTIGLFPKEMNGKMTAIGNGALGGVVKYLCDGNSPDELLDIVGRSVEFSLSEEKVFNEMFLKNTSFTE
jgi:uncharacterized 2Fe-2S/4Fe-4S cluster protein (DUF4445 family)